MAGGKATLKGTETRIVRSKQTGQRYLISVALPYYYYDHQEKTWPVVYLLDAEFFFGTVTEIVRVMSWCGSTHDAVIVGIGYPSNKPKEEAWEDVMALRTTDLTPVRDEGWENDQESFRLSGGGLQFYGFIRDEIIPMAEANYRINSSDRTLAGHSFGGLFALFAMLRQPKLFKNYIVGSPSLYWKNYHIFDVEDEYAQRRKTLPARLFLSIGELEAKLNVDRVADLERFSRTLESRNYKWFAQKKVVYADEDHCTVSALGLQSGMKFALKL